MEEALEPFSAFPGGEKGTFLILWVLHGHVPGDRHRGPGNHFLPIL